MPTKKQLCVLIFAASTALFAANATSAPVAAHTTSAATLSARETALLERINSVRAEHQLSPLRIDRVLVRTARAHSGRMLRQGVFGHGDFAGRMRALRGRFPLLGENIAWGSGSYASARSLVKAWMASPGHRANLLHPRFRRIGIGAPVGTFSGYRRAAVVTTDFAS